jgi:L-ascorbate metabolism protein UlaG (beta-lactamase superfamily)
MRVNNYVLDTPNLRIFFGSEACDLKPLREYRERANGRPIDVVFAPVNGLKLFGLLKLVMGGEEAVEATRILGAKTLVAIHDAHRRSLLFMVSPSSSGASAQAAAKAMADEVRVIRLATGERWEYDQGCSLP